MGGHAGLFFKGRNINPSSNRPIRLALAGDNRIYIYLAQGVLLKCGNSYNPQAFLMQGHGVSF
jgi:hypothetical protein